MSPMSLPSLKSGRPLPVNPLWPRPIRPGNTQQEQKNHSLIFHCDFVSLIRSSPGKHVYTHTWKYISSDATPLGIERQHGIIWIFMNSLTRC